jgi:drug/metabolite transporter (DMT)-like permease
MTHQQRKFLYLFILALVWGSSFILMKKALVGVTPIQLGALRMVLAAIFMLLIGFKSIKKIQRKHWKYIFITAFLGTFFPVFIFAFAVQGIDSSIVSILNSFTPLNAFLIGAFFFGAGFNKNQLLGISLGLIGALILIVKGALLNPDQNYWFALLVIIASMGYAFNANVLKKHLSDLSALSITVGHFILLAIPASLVLVFSGFFSDFSASETQLSALSYIVVLAIFGTGLAKILFNKLIQISTPVFSTSVTYLIPIVAISWGIFDGEKLELSQLFAGLIILLGVYLVNRAR